MLQPILDLLILFFSALVAATFLPAQSELVLLALHARGGHAVATLLVVATIGNVLGSCVNYGIGRWLVHFSGRRWFPVQPQAMERAGRIYQRFGVWTLLFSWVPVIGDPLTLAAGIFRTRFALFLLLVTTGKAARYAAILWAASTS